MKFKAKAFIICSAIAIALPATAAVRKVPQQYPTINAAIGAAANGDTIEVTGGPYIEQVLVNKSVKLMGKQSAVIKAPAVMTTPKAIVRISGSGVSATIQDFTITGPGGGGCDSLEYGVRVDGGAFASIKNNDVVLIRDNPFSGCQNGVAIEVGSSSASTTGSADISNNNVSGFQKNGITIDNTGSTATIENNDVQGAGPTAVNGQNGIQVSSGAVASVKNNSVSGMIYSPQTVAATGMLFFGAGDGNNIENNDVSSSDVGIYIYATNNSSVSNNKVSLSTYDDITIDTSNTNSVKNNKLDTASQGGPTDGAGISLYNASGNAISNNQSTKSTGDGFFADSATSGNVFTGNQANNNGGYGFDDQSAGTGTAGTANTYKNNKADKNTLGDSSPPGLAK